MIQRYEPLNAYESKSTGATPRPVALAKCSGGEYIKRSDVLALLDDSGIGSGDCCAQCDSDDYELGIINRERARLRAELGEK